MNSAIKALVDRWPSSLVARAEAGKFSGGAIRGRYFANLDSAGQGPSGAFAWRKGSLPDGQTLQNGLTLGRGRCGDK